MRIAKNAGAKQQATKAFYIELADEGEEPVHPFKPLQRPRSVVRPNSNDLRTTKKTRGKAKAGTLSNRSKAFEKELLNGTPERYPT